MKQGENVEAYNKLKTDIFNMLQENTAVKFRIKKHIIHQKSKQRSYLVFIAFELRFACCR